MGYNFFEDYKPVNVYRNNVKLAGWTATEKSGESVSYTDTYNDKFNSLIADGAEPQSLADWHGVNGSLTQNGTPTPTAPIAVTPNIAAGSYKIARPAGGWWTITLADDIRGISTYTDKVNVDLLTGKGKLRKKISKKVFDGTEFVYGSGGIYVITDVFTHITGLGLCTHYMYDSAIHFTGSFDTLINTSLRFRVEQATSAEWQSFLAAQYTAGTPVTVYYVLATETVTDLTLTHADTSDLPELTLADLGITVSSLDYPFTVYESNNNFISVSDATEVKQTVSLPTLRAIGTVKDRCDILTGVKTHKVSEWITIPQPTSYFQCLSSLDGFKRLNISALWDYYYGQVTPLIAYKYNSTQLMVRSTSSYSDSIQGSTVDSGTRISVSNTDSGWSDALTPTNAEVKAYFLGWQMCHSDGASPYYKSEVPYTPATWAEWTVNNGATKAATGIELTPYEQSVVGAWINTTIKNNTKYGIIFNIVSNTLNGFMSVGSGSRAISFGTMSAGITGMQKLIATSVAAISNNSFIMYINSASVTSGIVNFKDVRIFELPTGSQIEADFTNLTADQLAIKYPFYGLNPKNWKHITDGTGLTATLPTATYAGYTPYRLLYQLATPTDEQLTGETVPTYPWHTDITQTGDIKTTITANAKVMD